MVKKGEPLRFVNGKYNGFEGWVNAEKEKTKKMIYVIIDLGDGVLKTSMVKKSSVATPHESPDSYEEAALQQHPDIDLLMSKLARELARCHIGSDSNKMKKLFAAKLVHAESEQFHLGNRATWRDVQFGDDGL